MRWELRACRTNQLPFFHQLIPFTAWGYGRKRDHVAKGGRMTGPMEIGLSGVLKHGLCSHVNVDSCLRLQVFWRYGNTHVGWRPCSACQPNVSLLLPTTLSRTKMKCFHQDKALTLLFLSFFQVRGRFSHRTSMEHLTECNINQEWKASHCVTFRIHTSLYSIFWINWKWANVWPL